MKIRSVAIGSVWALFVVGSSVAGGCANQGEGERCTFSKDGRGNDDCQNGLQCYQASDLNGANPGSDRCCPVNRAAATVDVCRITTPPLGVDAAPPASGGSDAAADDAAAQQETGAGDDASSTPTDAGDGGD